MTIHDQPERQSKWIARDVAKPAAAGSLADRGFRDLHFITSDDAGVKSQSPPEGLVLHLACQRAYDIVHFSIQYQRPHCTQNDKDDFSFLLVGRYAPPLAAGL